MDKEDFIVIRNCIRKYDNKGEILKDKVRTVEWIDNFVFKERDWSSYKSILDVGSGNGRLNQIYKKYFDEIYNIELSTDIIDPRFNYDNVTTYREGFYKFSKKSTAKFDIILFAYSFRLIPFKYLLIKTALKLLSDNGLIIILESTDFEEKIKKGIYYFDLYKLCNEFGMSIERFSEHNTSLSFLKKGENKISKDYKNKFNWCMYCGKFNVKDNYCKDCGNGKTYPKIKFGEIRI